MVASSLFPHNYAQIQIYWNNKAIQCIQFLLSAYRHRRAPNV